VAVAVLVCKHAATRFGCVGHASGIRAAFVICSSRLAHVFGSVLDVIADHITLDASLSSPAVANLLYLKRAARASQAALSPGTYVRLR
jgi:hypothetical protein